MNKIGKAAAVALMGLLSGGAGDYDAIYARRAINDSLMTWPLLTIQVAAGGGIIAQAGPLKASVSVISLGHFSVLVPGLTADGVCLVSLAGSPGFITAQCGTGGGGSVQVFTVATDGVTAVGLPFGLMIAKL